MRFPLGAMSVGDILDRALKLFFSRLPFFYAANLIVLSPYLLLELARPYILGENRGEVIFDPGTLMRQFMLFIAFKMFEIIFVLVPLLPIANATILHVVMEQYLGKRATLGATLSFAFSRFMSLVGASILVGLIVAIGMLCCCAPGIYFFVSYSFAAQAVVLEKMPVGEALQRSYSLMEGYRLRVCGVLLLLIVCWWFLRVCLNLGLQQVMPSQEIVPAASGIRMEFNPLYHFINTSILELVSILCFTYFAVCSILLYLDLRIRKEGFDLMLATELENPSADSDARDDDGGWDDRDPNEDDRRQRSEW